MDELLHGFQGDSGHQVGRQLHPVQQNQSRDRRIQCSATLVPDFTLNCPLYTYSHLPYCIMKNTDLPKLYVNCLAAASAPYAVRHLSLTG
jgi:hypothetical protein